MVTVTKTWEDNLSNDERSVPDVSISTEKPSKNPLGYTITYHGNGLTFADGTTENEIIVNSSGKIVSGQYKELSGLQNSVPESYFRLAKVLTYPGTLDIYKMAGDCVNKVYLHEKGYAKQAEDIAAILSKFKGLFDSEEFEEDIKQDFFRRLYDIDYQEKTLSEYKRYIMKHLDKDAVKNSLWGINSFLSACTGNKYEKLMKEIDSGSYSHIEAFARKCLINNKTACLRLMQDNLKEFAKLPINSILFSNEFWQLCNMNTLTIKDLQKLQKYKYLYTTNNIDLSLFYNHTYTFPEFLSISLKNRKLIEIYNSLDPSMRVDEKLRRIRQLFHESIRMDNFPEDLISAVAKTLSKEPLSDYINRHSYLKETASISDFLYLESIESYNPGLKEVINEITGRIDILAVVNNYNNPKLKELGLKDFKNAYVSLDEDSAWLKEELPIPEEHQKSFLEFCLQGNASVTKSYYDDQYEKGQKNVLLLAKAAVYGKLDEVKYENFNAEIGFTLTGDQKEVWKENSKKQQYGLKATENTDFESCMKIGAVPTWTCMNYKSGQYNECLLSVFDANKKVLYVDKGSKCVARAIMRLTKMSDTAVNKTLSFRDVAEDAAMESGSDEKLVIFLERMYFSHLTNAEIIQVRKLLYDLAEAKATALGAKILVAQDYEDIAEEKLLKKTSTNVYISKSKNGDQYLDSLGGDCEKGGYYVKGNFYAPYEQ